MSDSKVSIKAICRKPHVRKFQNSIAEVHINFIRDLYMENFVRGLRAEEERKNIYDKHAKSHLFDDNKGSKLEYKK